MNKAKIVREELNGATPYRSVRCAAYVDLAENPVLHFLYGLHSAFSNILYEMCIAIKLRNDYN